MKQELLSYVRMHLSSQKRRHIKHNIRKIKSICLFWIRSVTIEKMRTIMTDELGIKAGDRIVVTSGFGGLNARFTPKELVELLMDIVTPKGMIMMPYYPPGSSVEWAKSGSVFDMNSTKSSTGIVPNVFSQMEGVVKSMHPTKSVCVWGEGAMEIIKDHINSRTPYSGGSPYDKLLSSTPIKGRNKSIGLGTLKFPMGHCIEDIVSDSLTQYQEGKYKLKIKDGIAEYVCETYVHDNYRHQIAPPEYVKGAPTYKKIRIGYSVGYVVDNLAAFEYYKSEFAKGHKSIW